MREKRKLKVLVFPEDRSVNPYQDLLYKDFKRYKNAKIKYFDASFFGYSYIPFGIFNFLIPLKLIKYRFQRYKIFHLHWFGPLRLPTENIVLRTISFVYLLFFLFLVRNILRYKIIWTVHEIKPPRKEFVNDLLARRIVSKMADAKIVHAETIKDEMKKHNFNTDNTFVIPHGNYINSYKNKITKEQARKNLKLEKDEFVFLFFGGISKHKGIESLLKAFSKLKIKKQKIRLLIVGGCHYKKFEELIEKFRKKVGSRLTVHPHFVEEDDVQYYFNCADVVVLPFANTTTSGSTILTLSFGKPIICPRMGTLKELPEEIGFFYNPNDKKGLLNSMNKAIKEKDKLEKVGKAGFNYAKNILNWSKISRSTYNVYNSVLKKK